MFKNLKLVYTGSRVEGLFLKEMLEDNKLKVMIKDTLSSSVQAGWADGSPEDTILIYVNEEAYEKAEKILNDYFTNRASK